MTCKYISRIYEQIFVHRFFETCSPNCSREICIFSQRFGMEKNEKARKHWIVYGLLVTVSYLLVGTTRFELATPCTPCKCATGLRYVPNFVCF